MPERFDPAPRWARRVLWTLAVTAYALMLLLSVIVITWPAHELSHVEIALARVGGLLALAASAVCLASYPWHRWRWEMHGTWVLGFGLTIVTAGVAGVPTAAASGRAVGATRWA